jgi:glucose-1-phosphate adenylyltransferase
MHNILRKTSTFVLAGGRGSRLSPLTRHRSKPAVPFGDGCIIDFTLRNCLQSNLLTPHIITQYESAHLTRHVRRWSLEHSMLVDLSTPVCVPAPQPAYSGTADALFRNTRSLNGDTEHVLVLSADHIYDMNYSELLRFHFESGADATIASIQCPSESSRQFGILEIGLGNRIIGFQEKPSQPKELPGYPGIVLANMGIYVFRRDVLIDALRLDAEDPISPHDIGRDILPKFVRHQDVYTFEFEGYWKDVGTIDSYYDANMEWLRALPGNHHLAGSGSVIARGVRIHPTAEVIDSILMPGVVISANARVRRAILDENVRVQTGAQIGNDGFDDQIAVVPANTTVRRKSDDPRRTFRKSNVGMSNVPCHMYFSHDEVAG